MRPKFFLSNDFQKAFPELKSYHFSDGTVYKGSSEVIFLDAEVKICHEKCKRKKKEEGVISLEIGVMIFLRVDLHQAHLVVEGIPRGDVACAPSRSGASLPWVALRCEGVQAPSSRNS